MDWSAFLPPVIVSVKVAVVASIIVFLLATVVARMMAYCTPRRGTSVIETVLLLPLVLPPTVVGFILLILLGRKSWIGTVFESLFQQTIVFTWGAAVVAAVVVAFPLAYRTIKAGFEAVDPEVEQIARVQGANEWQVFRHITMPLAYRPLISGYILGFARGLGEFGATLMLAGNIPEQTQTLPTAIYTASEVGNMTLSWSWVAVIILFSFIMLMLSNRLVKD
ncbi:molybdate ABC transporter permease subunit [Paenibacillus sp. 23TSA30-6]|uniref:molybdate ABC transporter permease subunit n=1 Tax=Paenibacillus sp. 23TSA30-6 TaxID=2546104 RepID=UPI001787DF44|nr:molybdate ABC transporter permease subunit [Paenibacillus sp. 23TSA30-6]MBE0337163.1 molybdate ABC transporter permease subunit [Paenibacillus sp. 23TSA30-6]